MQWLHSHNKLQQGEEYELCEDKYGRIQLGRGRCGVRRRYAENAAAEFPEAEILLSVATGNESAVVISVYPDKDAFDRSAAARAARLGSAQNRIKGVEVLEGEVTLCHCNYNCC